MELKNKKGMFFSTDALIALIIILSFVLIVYPLFHYLQPSSEVHTDILSALTTLKISDVHTPFVDGLAAAGKIKDPNATVLEEMGYLYVYDPSEASALAYDVLQDFDTTENVGIWFGNTLIYSKNDTPYERARDVEVARQVISGIEAGENITGYAALATLSSSQRTQYFYFGGYVGDGNISASISYSGNISSTADIEVAISNNFSLYVNDDFIGDFEGSSNVQEPVRYTFSTASFSPGENIVELKGKNLYVAGGFIKIHYNSDATSNEDYSYKFPGIRGLINLYDGFYIPSNLSSMNLFLKLDTNYSYFLNLGNVTVYNNTGSDATQTVSLDNSYLSGILDYESLEGKNVPLRLGLYNISYIESSGSLDLFSVTDISGSMTCSEDCPLCYWSESACVSAGGVWQGPIQSAKTANNALIDAVLNLSGNRIGVLAYEYLAREEDYFPLSSSSSAPQTEVSQWDAEGGTCICCGLEKAVQSFFGKLPGGRLVTYYDFDSGVSGTVSDESGMNYDASVVGSPSSASGLDNSAIEFSGTGNDYLVMPDILNQTEGSISFWFDPDRDNSMTIFDASTSTRYFFIDIESNRYLRFHFEDSADIDINDISRSVTGIHNTGWHHVVAVWRLDRLPAAELYLDGVLVGTDTHSANTMANFDTPYIGKFRTANSPSDWSYDGKLDDFRIYTRALNRDEILELSQSTGSSCGNDLTELGEVCDGDAISCNSGSSEGVSRCDASCSGYLACDTTNTCGNGFINTGEECDDSNTISGDGCSDTCTIESRNRQILLMSDGIANTACTGQYSESLAKSQAIQVAQDACSDYGITTHTVGFGEAAEEATLISIANSGCNGTYTYSDISNLSNIYQQIANRILSQYQEQTLTANGTLVTELHPDSYINFTYPSQTFPYGLRITSEVQFSDSSGGTFLVPEDSTPLVARIASYSGPKWTTGAIINGLNIFNINSYNKDYISLGDPYQMTLVNSVLTTGENFASVTTGVSPSNQSSGSVNDKIIYTIIKNASTFTDIMTKAEGCVWEIRMEDDTTLTVSIPSTYSGSDLCYFDDVDEDRKEGYIANEFDAYQVAVKQLLNQLDFDNDGRSDAILSGEDFDITLSEISGIPFDYSTEVQVRRWV